MATVVALATSSLAVSTAGFAATTSTAGAGSDSSPADAGTVTQASTFAGAATPVSTHPAASLAEALANPTPDFTSTTIEAAKSTISPNAEARFTITVRDALSGRPVVDEDVNVVVVTGTRWTTSATLRTDEHGAAQIGARLLSTTTVTAVFDGSVALRPSVANATTVTVTSSTIAGSASGNVSAIPGSTIGARAVYLASLQKGKPYVWGATGPYAFDCSGFSQYIFKQLGRYLPRTAQQQFNATLRVPQSAKQPGDLIFFGTPNNIYHMGIYAGNGYMWAAPQTGDVVKLEPIYTSRYYVGRVL
ncbi:C40 family peptidase [Frankia sp. AgB1.9]|uniref:C40 family peptidase n=1 Tax=unclassified Frankia TaxID=2632575 RepID=UPI0019343215|nr:MULTISPECIES: C40 family peptidase [unclassified Frankia]MBL7492783.1 C40 family peptidase [Frankia sp. AgW1.1]MBL7549286.1 C40 family peptidase [Frankia sp. AgB1.9]MBL7619246.1 C40 family peptidase [Frankia sp. AgB1.8]